MKLKSIVASLFLSLGLGLIMPVETQAQDLSSGVFVEPAVTYELGNSTVDYPSPFSTSTGTINGLGVGAKLGMHVSEVVFLALDARYAMPQYKDSSVTYDSQATSVTWGPVVGVQMPDLGLRLWGSVILGGELNPSQSGSFDVAFKKASGYRIGTGFRLANVSLNLEYQQLKYAETTLEQVGPFSSTSALSNVKLENKAWIASVSFPLAI